ncbi:MAG: 1-deoxy-D-xylulose-5-phosphate reductoisomerase [Clostridiales bacterium]|nr:1-deoxy-D-xylulose-5-phosphate reductoisomerase [Clostridiales bacterium]
MMKRISLLGSTGSIGTQALDVARMQGYQIVALAANSNVKRMEAQIREFRPALACLTEPAAAKDLRRRVADTDTKVVSGMDGLCECAAYEASDIVLNSVVGMVGLRPTLTAIQAGKDIALANKETLVCAGELVMRRAAQAGVAILPVDSEHSAIFQSLQGSPGKDAVKRVILTASGGPFFGRTQAQLAGVTAADALKHPNWDMGAKITIDCATMMNKGLEFIEAVWLFDLVPAQIDVVVHRESVIHSLVEYRDNSVIAQLGVPDMRIPIQYALTYPARYPSPVKALDLADYGRLTFAKPDEETFRCLAVCKEAIRRGGLCPAAANGANEEAVTLVRAGPIAFFDIPALVRGAMEAADADAAVTLESVLETERAARAHVRAETRNS